MVPAPWWAELGVVPLVGKAMSSHVFIGGCWLRNRSIRLSSLRNRKKLRMKKNEWNVSDLWTQSSISIYT